MLAYITMDTQIATSQDLNKILDEAIEWAGRVLVQVGCPDATLDIDARNTDITCILYSGGVAISCIILDKGDSK